MPEPNEIEQWIEKHEKGINMDDKATRARVQIVKDALEKEKQPSEFDDVEDWILYHPLEENDGKLTEMEMSQIVNNMRIANGGREPSSYEINNYLI